MRVAVRKRRRNTRAMNACGPEGLAGAAIRRRV